MRIYYEVIAHSEDNDAVIDSRDISGMTEQEKAEMLVSLKATYGPACTYRQHNCRHDEGLPCETLRPL